MKMIALAVLLGGHAADFTTSLHRQEMNPILGTGTFRPGRAAAIKVGAVAGLLLVEHKTGLRRHDKALNTVNLSVGGIAAAAAARNLTTACDACRQK